MGVADVIELVTEAGISIALDENQSLLVAPASKLTPHIRDLIRMSKPDLVKFVRHSESVTRELIVAAMRACDHHGDSQSSRDQMRQDCLDTPLSKKEDLLDHFQVTYGNQSRGNR